MTEVLDPESSLRFFLVEGFAKEVEMSEGVENLLVLEIVDCCCRAKVLRVIRIVKVRQHGVP